LWKWEATASCPPCMNCTSTETNSPRCSRALVRSLPSSICT